MAKQKKLGIIQTRGLGDIVIALPIAGHYYDQGYEIYWPILEEFVPNVINAVPWVKWIPIPHDPPGAYFYDIPVQRLKNFGVTETLPLYQHLTGQDFSKEPYFQYTKFDQYKYIRAGVPFLKKWDLAKYITRDPQREQALYDRLVVNPQYAVVHLEGSDHTATWDPAMIPEGWQTIIMGKETDCLFDWLTILERAESLVLTDSVVANLVDQLNIGTDRYFLQRSHIGLTPVHGGDWTWI